MVKISIIVPVYNSEKSLQKCLQSIHIQKYKEFEVVIINDGSTDNSLNIIEEFTAKDGRFKSFSKPNTGVSSSRNFGLSKSRGDYVTFIDSDDTIESNYLLSYIDKINKNKSDLICQGYISIYYNYKTITKLENIDYHKQQITDAIYDLELKECLSSVWNKIFKKSIIDKNNLKFDENISLGEDKLFSIRFIYFTKIVSTLNYSLYNYNRMYENTLSKKHHEYNKLKYFIEKEYFYFKEILTKYPSKKMDMAVNARYVSFNKFILFWMYKPKSGVTKDEIIKQKKLIKEFYNSNEIDVLLDRELPKKLEKLLNYGLIVNILIRLNMLTKKIKTRLSVK